MRKRRIRRYGWTPIVTLIAAFSLSGCGRQFMVLHPAGPVGKTELNLIYISAGLMLLVIIPALVLFAWILVR